MRDQDETQRDRQARDIFLRAVEIESREAQVAYIEGACQLDASLRSRVEASLENHRKDSFLEVPAIDKPTVLSATPLSEGPGTVIGRYKLLQKIGEGGCGVVYMAEQEEPVRRRLALKVIKLGMDTKSVIARFEAERQALAMMDHSNIAKVLDGGATDSGRPYFVMELVRGVKITEFCDEHNFTAHERLDLFLKVCQAIQHAHQKGIIHRDIKPSNILVTINDGVAVPKVIDFGIAKATEGRLTDSTLFTAFEQLIGTPAYMSPEQAVMTSLDIDTRSDIYSLGVLLYELLTGKTPFDAKELAAAGLEEMRRTIRDKEPARPSTRLSALSKTEATTTAKRRRSDLPKLITMLRGDLDWIVMKCLEKDRQRRYETANGLASDIQRHLRNEPVVARPPSTAYRFQKMIRRNKLAFAAAASIVAVLVLGLSVSTWQAVVATRARKVADSARVAETRERSIAQTERDRAQTEAARAEKEKLVAERNAYAAAMLVAQADWDNANLAHLRQILEETSSYPDKGFEWFYWQRMCRTELMTLRDHDGPVSAVCYSPDGSRIASAGQDGTVRISDATTGRALQTLRGNASEVHSVAFSADGLQIITGGRDSTVRIWDGTSGKPGQTFSGRAGALLPDGHRLLIASLSGQAALLEISTGRELAKLGEQEIEVKTLAASRDGTRVLSVSADGAIRVWKLDTVSQPTLLWRHVIRSWETEGRPAAFSPDGHRIVCSGRDRIVRIWDITSGRELQALAGHGEQVSAVGFSPDGRRVASASLDRTIKVWEIENGRELLTLRGHTETVTSLAFSPDGQRLVTGSQDRTVKVWDSTNPVFPRLSGGELSQVNDGRLAPMPREKFGWRSVSTNGLTLVRFSPNGRQLLTASDDGTARLWDAASLKEIRMLGRHTHILSHANFSPDGRTISSGGYDGTIYLWDAATGEELRRWRGNWGVVYWTKVSTNGKRVLSATVDGFIRIFDTATEDSPREWKAHEPDTWAVEYYPNEQRLVSCGSDGIIKVWDASSGRELMALRGHTGLIIALAFSPDGKKFVSGGTDRTIRVWDAADGRPLLTLRGHVDQIWDVNFSPDGRRLVSASYDKTVRIWEAENGRELLTLRGNSDYFRGAVFSPDGKRLACAGEHPSFEVWETAAPDEISRWRAEEENAAKRWAVWDEQAKDRKVAGRPGLIKSWLILAPIPVAADKSSAQQVRAEQVTGESDLRPRSDELVRVGSQEFKWKAIRAEDGIVDFNRFVGPGDHSAVAAYAVCYVRSAQARQGLRLKVGSDDQSRVYLNDKLLYEYPFRRPLYTDQDTVAGVDLQAGLNVIVFKVINLSGPWSGALRFVDEQDNPVQGLKFTTTPD